MMRRLRDDQGTDRVLEHAARLVRAAAPPAVTPAQRARVWSRVVADGPQGLVARVPWLECASVLLLAAVAATAVVSWGVLRARGQPPSVATGGTPPVLTPRPAPTRLGGQEPPAPAPPAPTPRDDERREPEPASQRAPQPTSVVPEPPPPEPPPASQPLGTSTPAPRPGAEPDSALVLDAVRALRRDRDSYRASSRLYQYLCLHPDGPLAEEALGLAIEAAAARRDGRAVPLADEYLARYPGGRYAGAASHARSRFVELARARGVLAWRIPCGQSR